MIDPNHDIVPTLRLFDGVMTGLAADEIERLRARVKELEDAHAAKDAPAQQATVAQDGQDLTYEIWQDDMIVATSTDPKDASHYAAVYSQDGPVKVYTVLRSDWEGKGMNDEQDWANTSPGVAWHLIDRHAENWQQVGEMMEAWARAWVAANPEGKKDEG